MDGLHASQTWILPVYGAARQYVGRDREREEARKQRQSPPLKARWVLFCRFVSHAGW